MELTHFQEIVAMALDLPDTDAAKVTRAWPKTEEALRKALRQWKVATGSKVKGHDLLSICGEVWRHKPIGLSEGKGVKFCIIRWMGIQSLKGLRWMGCRGRC